MTSRLCGWVAQATLSGFAEAMAQTFGIPGVAVVGACRLLDAGISPEPDH